MGTRTQTFNRGILDLVYKNTALAGIGDSNGLQPSASAGSLYVALLDSSGDEIAYTGYARQAITRGAGFTRTANVVSNTSELTFVVCPTGTTPQTATQAAIFTALTGGTKLHQADLTDEITIAAAHQPVVQAGALTITGAELSE